MPQTVKIRLRNTGQTLSIPNGITLAELYQQSGLRIEYGPMCARVNNKNQGLGYRFYNSKDVEFLDIRSASGMRAYTRTLFLVLAKAVEDLYPQGRLIIGAAISGGYYCELRIGRQVTQDDAQSINQRMEQIIAADLPIHHIQCPIEEAISLFQSKGMDSKVKLLQSQTSLYTDYYQLADTIDYFYSCLLTHTGAIHLFQVIPFYDGLLLRIPSAQDPSQLETLIPQTKMHNVIREHQRWQDILGCRTAGDFNEAVQSGYAPELINISEALQEKKLNQIVDTIQGAAASSSLQAPHRAARPPQPNASPYS